MEIRLHYGCKNHVNEIKYRKLNKICTISGNNKRKRTQDIVYIIEWE